MKKKKNKIDELENTHDSWAFPACFKGVTIFRKKKKTFGLLENVRWVTHINSSSFSACFKGVTTFHSNFFFQKKKKKKHTTVFLNARRPS